MSFANRICQALHEEHRATIALMERLEQLLAKFGRGGVPDYQDATVARMLRDLSTGVEAEVARHFDFEEHQLFPYLEAAGDSAIGEHLAFEHTAMRPLGMRLAELTRNAASEGFDPAGWDEFRKIGQELSDRMLAHVQKEEMALLPLLDEVMDSEVEARLYQDYVENM